MVGEPLLPLPVTATQPHVGIPQDFKIEQQQTEENTCRHNRMLLIEGTWFWEFSKRKIRALISPQLCMHRVRLGSVSQCVVHYLWLCLPPKSMWTKKSSHLCASEMYVHVAPSPAYNCVLSSHVAHVYKAQRFAAAHVDKSASSQLTQARLNDQVGMRKTTLIWDPTQSVHKS